MFDNTKFSDLGRKEVGVSASKERYVQFVRDPQRKAIELRYSRYAEETFFKHSHDSFAIGVVRQGESRFAHYQPDEQIFEIGGKDIILLNPGEVHACNPKPGSVLAYFMLYVGCDFMQEVTAAIADRTNLTDGALVSEDQAEKFLFRTPIVHDVSIYQSLLGVCLAMMQQDGRLEIETGLFEALTPLALKYGSLNPQRTLPSVHEEALLRSREFLLDNLQREVSLQELSASSGLSPYYFVRAFRNCFGLPPHMYQNQQRVNLAKQLLARGMSIAQVAAEVGFADQSHLTRKFKSLVGATPRQYQQALLIVS
jgi:AraC-like DNA-binding protein